MVRFLPVRSAFGSAVRSAFSFAVLALLLATGVRAQEPAVRFAPDRLIVRFAEPLTFEPGLAAPRWADPALADLASSSGVVGARPLFPERQVRGDAARVARAAELRRTLGLTEIYVLQLGAAADVERLAARWATHPAVVFAEPDFAGMAAGATGPRDAVTAPMRDVHAPMTDFPNDPYFNRQWALHNTGSHPGIPSAVADADVNAPEAWDLAQGSPSVVIGIIDSGVRLGHPDIAARVWTNAGETANGTDDDANGYVDDVRGWDFVNNDNDPTDDNGHGSNVAGLVGAIGNNALGYVGLDRGARLMILKGFASDLSFFYSWTTAAITYAADEGAHVINLSGGGSTTSAAMEAAADYAYGLGVFFTAAMMNFNNAVPYYPAAFTNVVGVGATNALDERAAPFCWGGGSNYGPHIELSAPGDRIYNITHSSDTNFDVYWCGTSMAAPTVAAAAALMLSVNPSLTPAALLGILRATAEDQVGRPTEDTPGFDVYHGHGRLDAHAALTSVTTATEGGADALSTTLAVAPNPASGAARLTLTLDAARAVTVAVYDALGRRVATLHDGLLAAGPHTLLLDTSALPGGVYLVRATDGETVSTRRLTVVR